MRNIILLLKKDILRFWVDKPNVLLTFLLPAVLIIIFGNIFSSDSPRGKIDIALVLNSDSKVAKVIEQKFDSSQTVYPVKYYKPEGSKTKIKLTEEIAKAWVKEGKLALAVIIPEDFISDTSSSVNLKIYYDPKNEIESNILQGEIQKIIMTELPQIIPALLKKNIDKEIGESKGDEFNDKFAGLVSQYWGVPKDSIKKQMDINQAFSNLNSGKDDDLIGSLINIEQVQLVGNKVNNPGVTRTTGGWAMMFLLFSIVGAANSLFEEKQEGTLKRLLSMPVRKSEILWSKYIFAISLGIVQLLVFFLVAWLLFDVDIFSNFFNLFLMILFSAMAAVSFGMIITSFATSISQANGISTLIILIMSAIGGSWFPTFLLPDWLQTISKLTIVYWSVDGFLQVLWRETGFSGIVVHSAILLSTAFVLNFYAIVRLRKGSMFN